MAQLVKSLPAMQETWIQSPGEGSGNPLLYFSVENSMDRRAWRATVDGIANSQTRLSD